MDNIQSDIKYLIGKLQQDKDNLERLLILDRNFSSFHTYTSYFDEVVSQNVVRELVPINLRLTVSNFINSTKSDSSKSGIEFVEPIFKKIRLYTRPMHPSELSSILFNLYTNSKKAIKRSNSDGKILIECGEFENYVYLEFSDNGDGISKENEEKVFDEFFTTSSPMNYGDISISSEILGTGLGLKIVKDIVKSYNGNISVVSPSMYYSTCIRIEVPKVSPKDADKYEV